MKKIFWEYYHPTKKEIENIKNKGVYVFDACSLLNLYTFTSAKRNKIFKEMKRLSTKKRVFITNQNCKEYHSKRLGKIEEQYKLFQEMLVGLRAKKNGFNLEVEFKEHFTIKAEKIISSIQKELNKSIEKNITIVSSAKKEFPDWRENDPIRRNIESIFKYKVGEPYSEEEYEKKVIEAQERKNKKKRPGNSDESLGDIISWFQLIDFVKSKKIKNVLYITEETKADFFTSKKVAKNTLPAPELIREMYEENGTLFFIQSIEDIISNKIIPTSEELIEKNIAGQIISGPEITSSIINGNQ